ncbi:O-antigen ligase family protein [Sabulicella rubraurantiaca]|uniref:O-antigen ligase family protein n=1 Tax=Sabulicella rubraurantiaca TaxID=2811429 RepID=UPI001A96C013|nr:O-antigen ligase family protein [Sabulicella rubraurantiaca]
MNRAPLSVAAALALLPLALVLQSRAMAPLALLGLAGTVLLAWREGWRPSHLPRPAWPLLALLAWAAVSALWSPEPGRALDTSLRLAAMTGLGAMAGAALLASPSPRIGYWAAGGLALGLAVAALDDATGNAVRAAVRGLPEAPAQLAFGLKNAMAGMALLAPLAFAHPSVPLPLRVLLAAGVVFVSFLLPGEAAKLASLAAVAAALLAAFAVRSVGMLIGLVGAAFVLAAPFLARFVLGGGIEVGELPFSAAHRLLIWDFVASRITDSPLIGWGMEASRTIPGGTGAPDAAVLARFGVSGPYWATAQLLPLHPHNAALQIWLELGAVGAVLAAWLLVELGRAARSPAAVGCFAAGLVVAMLSYGVWQYWWVAGLLLAAAACAAVPDRGAR